MSLGQQPVLLEASTARTTATDQRPFFLPESMMVRERHTRKPDIFVSTTLQQIPEIFAPQKEFLCTFYLCRYL